MKEIHIVMILIVAIILSTQFTIFGTSYASEITFYTEKDQPFGVTLGQWIEKYWAWWIKVPLSDFDESTMKPISNCLMNKSESMVLLMELTVKGNPHQECTISGKQGIIVPIWTGYWYETDADMKKNNWTDDYLLMNARTGSNAGEIDGEVKIDGAVIANVHAISDPSGVKYTLKENITEVGAKGFKLTFPANGHTGVPEGTYPSAVHGWFVFVKPLKEGDHTISYNVGVGEGQKKDLNKARTEVNYLIHVTN
ncbi:MAG TPA: hypothetical protein VJS91_04090 [Nitrososphaeraceae archaeon]|nr:hypothetical protein [Nitrososphaeraceae archaeon]